MCYRLLCVAQRKIFAYIDGNVYKLREIEKMFIKLLVVTASWKGYTMVWGDGKVLYCGSDYMSVHICQNGSNCALKMV